MFKLNRFIQHRRMDGAMSAICIVYIVCLPLYVIFLIKPAAGHEEASKVFPVVGEDAD